MTDQPEKQFDAAAVIHDYADALADNTHPDAATWAEALRWASARIVGGHRSIYAAREFTDKFGVHPYGDRPV